MVSASNFKGGSEYKTTATTENKQQISEVGNQKNVELMGGMKRGYVFEKSESNKESFSDLREVPGNQNDLMIIIPSEMGIWHEVKNRKIKKDRM
ncbi:hypothetical protein KI387_030888, partial [Taxus chinensis]